MAIDWKEYKKLKEKALLLTLKSVCKALQEQGITSVEMSYEGGGDDGDYDSPVFTNKDGEDVSPDGDVESFRAHREWHGEKKWINAKVVDDSADLEDVTTDLMYGAVTMRHSGWENNHGGEGTVSLDVGEQRLSVNHGNHHIATTWDEYSLCAEGGEE